MRISIFVAALAASVAFTPAFAVTTIRFENIKGVWFDAVPQGSNSDIGITSDPVSGDSEVRWGRGGRSGYDFTASASPVMQVDLGSPSDSTVIGDFSHLNRVINSGTSISAISLKFTTDVYVGDEPLQTVTFFYDFSHWETPNDSNRCANGGANNRGVNENGCADRVRVTFNSQSDGFAIGNYVYALDIMGFIADGQEVSEFWTKEKANNNAQILGRVALYSELIPEVPEPATWAMMIAGFGMVGFAARRRQNIARVAA